MDVWLGVVALLLLVVVFQLSTLNSRAAEIAKAIRESSESAGSNIAELREAIEEMPMQASPMGDEIDNDEYAGLLP